MDRRRYLTCNAASRTDVADDCRASSSTSTSRCCALVHPGSLALAQRAVSRSAAAACCWRRPADVPITVQHSVSICFLGNSSGPRWNQNGKSEIIAQCYNQHRVYRPVLQRFCDLRINCKHQVVARRPQIKSTITDICEYEDSET